MSGLPEVGEAAFSDPRHAARHLPPSLRQNSALPPRPVISMNLRSTTAAANASITSAAIRMRSSAARVSSSSAKTPSGPHRRSTPAVTPQRLQRSSAWPFDAARPRRGQAGRTGHHFLAGLDDKVRSTLARDARRRAAAPGVDSVIEVHTSIIDLVDRFRRSPSPVVFSCCPVSRGSEDASKPLRSYRGLSADCGVYAAHDRGRTGTSRPRR